MVILDTCTLLWLAADQSKLSGKARSVISANAGSLFVSSISAFEIAVKHKKKKLVLPEAPGKWFPAVLEHHGIAEIPVDSSIAIDASALPPFHNDPADRIIIATAITHGMIVLTPDHCIGQYGEVIAKW